MADQTAPRADYHQLVRSDILPLVPADAGSLLDVGGGIGATAATIKNAGQASSITVFDLVADNALPEVDAARAVNLEDTELFRAALLETGPKFDTILCLDVLEHLIDPWKTIEILHEHLADNGVIIASIPNVRNIRLIGPLIFSGRFDLQDAGICDRTHLRWFVRGTAIELMTGSGLKLEKVIDKLLPQRRYKYLSIITAGLFDRFWEIQYLIRVRKVAESQMGA